MNMFGFTDAAAIDNISAERRAPRPGPLEDEVVALFEQLRVPVLRYMISRGVPVPDAEEMAQEVFLLLFRHLREGKPAANPAGWVFRAAHNFVLKHHERSGRQARRFAASGKEAADVADAAVRADEALEEAQRQNNLLAVVRALPEEDQQCLQLRAEGLRYRQIAAILGISLGSVSNSLQRSIARLTRAEKE